MARPAKYTNPIEISELFDIYLDKCRSGERVVYINKRGQTIDSNLTICPSIKGFARFLGFATQSGFDDMGKRNEMSVIVSRVKTDIEIIRDNYAELGIIEPQIARMDYAKRNNLTDSRHSIEIDIGHKLREALSRSGKANSKAKHKILTDPPTNNE